MNWDRLATVTGLAVIAVGGGVAYGEMRSELKALDAKVAELSSPRGKTDICTGLSAAWVKSLPKGMNSFEVTSIDQQMTKFGCAALASGALKKFKLQNGAILEDQAMGATIDICALTREELKPFNITERDVKQQCGR